jgi:hypothetical protein
LENPDFPNLGEVYINRIVTNQKSLSPMCHQTVVTCKEKKKGVF